MHRRINNRNSISLQDVSKGDILKLSMIMKNRMDNGSIYSFEIALNIFLKNDFTFEKSFFQKICILVKYKFFKRQNIFSNN